MAERVLAFTRANPPDDAGQVAIADRLQEVLTRSDALALQERPGRAAVKVAVQRRRATRAEIHRMHGTWCAPRNRTARAGTRSAISGPASTS